MRRSLQTLWVLMQSCDIGIRYTDVCSLWQQNKNCQVSEKIAVYVDETETNTIPYEESTCHHLFLPKYTKIEKILGGIVHLTPFGKYFKSWSRFGELNEKCARCGKAPGSRGCTLVNTRCELHREYFMVDHTNNTQEPILFKFEDVVVEHNPTPVPENQS